MPAILVLVTLRLYAIRRCSTTVIILLQFMEHVVRVTRSVYVAFTERVGGVDVCTTDVPSTGVF